MHDFLISINAYDVFCHFHMLLISLKNQVKDIPVHIHFDKPYSERGIPVSSIEKLQEAHFDLIHKYIPHAEIFRAEEYNKRHFMRVKTLRNSFKLAKSCLYLKSVVFLHPRYIEIIRVLLNKFEKNKEIAMVNAYGDSHYNEEEVKDKLTKLKVLNNPLAWATWKDRWDSIDSELDNYLECIHDWHFKKKEIDYCDIKMKRWLNSLGFKWHLENRYALTNAENMIKLLFTIGRKICLSTVPNYLTFISIYYENLNEFENLLKSQSKVHQHSEVNLNFIWNDEVRQRIIKEIEHSHKINWDLDNSTMSKFVI